MINATDKKGKTALQYASEANQNEVTKLLIKHGAEQVIKSPNGKNAMKPYGKKYRVKVTFSRWCDKQTGWKKLNYHFFKDLGF